MTEAIIITLIIVSSIIALAWLVLHFGYKAWCAEREEKAGGDMHVTYSQSPPPFEQALYASGLDEETAKRVVETQIKYGPRIA